MEPKETMANVTPQKKVSPHQPHFLHADQIALIASMLDHFDGLAIATDGNGRPTAPRCNYAALTDLKSMGALLKSYLI